MRDTSRSIWFICCRFFMTSMPTLFWTTPSVRSIFDQVGLPLRVDVAQQLGDPQRELALLPLLALLDERADAPR